MAFGSNVWCVWFVSPKNVIVDKLDMWLLMGCVFCFDWSVSCLSVSVCQQYYAKSHGWIFMKFLEGTCLATGNSWLDFEIVRNRIQKFFTPVLQKTELSIDTCQFSCVITRWCHSLILNGLLRRSLCWLLSSVHSDLRSPSAFHKVATCLEDLEKSGNLKVIMEMGKVRENVFVPVMYYHV